MPRSNHPHDPPIAEIIGADIPLEAQRYPLRELLQAFQKIAQARPQVKLVLAGRRSAAETFSIWNFLDEHELHERIEFLPYFDVCRDFPIKKSDCAVWIPRDVRAEDLTEARLLQALEDRGFGSPKIAMFFTSFHPYKLEGNSTNMRNWLRRLRAGGYKIHLVYYMLDIASVTAEMRAQAQREYEYYVEVEVTSRLVGHNQNGLNVHIDDWCGGEAMEAVSALCNRFEYDLVVVNYPFMSAVFDAIPAYTRKVLFTHDSFADRNKRMLAEGYSNSSWVSISAEGERAACRRADVVVALQDDEAKHFEAICEEGTEIITVSPVFPLIPSEKATAKPDGRLIIGYFGSSNWVNEANLGLYLAAWLDFPVLAEQSEIVIAGGFSRDLFCRVVPDGEAILERVQPKFLGRVEKPRDFFEVCDIVINPDRGGTGIKIKTLEALAAGAAVVATRAGAIGLGSDSRFHDAEDATALARITAEICADRALLTTAYNECAEVYARYSARNADAFDRLLGPIPAEAAPGGEGPRVSVIIPFYNVEEFLGDCIQSVLDQDYRNLEIILVDDASKDGSTAVAARYAAQDGRVHIVTHAVNQGLGPARNSGVEQATGDYILFVDSDDLLSSRDAIGNLVSAARQSGSEITVGACIRLLPDGTLEPLDAADARGSLNEHGGVVTGIEAFRSGLRFPNAYYLPPRAWGALIETRFYKSALLDFPPGEHEDMVHTAFIYFVANQVLYIADPIVNYRVRHNSISNTPWPRERILRYRQLWDLTRTNLQRFGLEQHDGDAAVNLLRHMVWRVDMNNTPPIDWDSIAKVASEIFSAVGSYIYEHRLYEFLDYLRATIRKTGGPLDRFSEVIRFLPPSIQLNYYRRQVGLACIERVVQAAE